MSGSQMSGDPRRRAPLLSTLASSALAALAVFVLVGVLVLAFGEDGDQADRAGSDPLVVVTLSPTPLATPSVGASPSVSPSASAGPSATSSASASASATQAPVDKVPVIVLNQTGISGLAAKFQEELEAGGWTVAGIDDFRGNVPATTVYFPRGMRPAAVALMEQFPQIGRIRPAFSGISASQLTVILGKDFPTSS